MRPERGTTLLLFPAAVMVILVLGAVAVDLGQLQLAHREMVREVGSAADDAAQRIDLDALRRTGEIHIDLARARATALDELAHASLPGRPDGVPSVTLGETPGTVVVVATREVDHLFGRSIPGVPASERITVRLVGSIETVQS